MATMSDSIRVVEEDSVQRIHSNKLHGKLHKGTSSNIYIYI